MATPVLRIRDNNGNIKSIPAIRGEKGEKGDTGATPVKGTDYFTNEDKQDIVNAVLAALPAAEGVSI